MVFFPGPRQSSKNGQRTERAGGDTLSNSWGAVLEDVFCTLTQIEAW